MWELQKQKWDPVLNWFRDHYKVKLDAVVGISAPMIPQETLDAVKKDLLSYSIPCLQGSFFPSIIHVLFFIPPYISLLNLYSGLIFCASSIHSLVLPLALAKSRIDVAQAVYLSKLETLYQVIFLLSIKHKTS